MSARRFLHSIAAAIVLALAIIPFLLVASPMIGSGPALGTYYVLAVTAYLAAIAPSLRAAVRTGALAALLGAALLVLANGHRSAVLALALLLAILRSGILYRRQPGRAMLTEGLLVAGGLGFARLLIGPSPLSLALGLWGFFLVQSLFFLVAGATRTAAAPVGDPFTAARGRALALMDL